MSKTYSPIHLLELLAVFVTNISYLSLSLSYLTHTVWKMRRRIDLMECRFDLMECHFDALPEECISNILSWTTPLDVYRLSVVSKTFYSASQADIVWDRFLPSDLISILSRSDQHSSLIANSPSNKSIYLSLSENPIIIDNAAKSFHPDKRSAKKCYMLAPRTLDITWDDYPEHWAWENLPSSRFPEVVVLKHMWFIEIHGEINVFSLSPKTKYAAYLVFKLSEGHGHGFDNRRLELSVRIADPIYTYPKLGALSSLQITAAGCSSEFEEQMSDNSDCSMGFISISNRKHRRSHSRRCDGWLEIEIGSFYVSGIVDDLVHMSVVAREEDNWMGGLIIQGIEVRPK